MTTTVAQAPTSGSALARKARQSNAGRKPGPLGRKGRETRQALMDAAARLLATTSPINLSVLAISAEAGSSPATFYVYFDNVEDVLWTLCEAAGEDVSGLFPDNRFLRDPARLDEDAITFVSGYAEIWSKHGPVLLYRNMEADRGNKRFNQLLLRNALPILEALTDRIVDLAPADNRVSRSDANAEAVVFFAGMDRVAGALNLYPEDSLMPVVLLEAQARVLVRMLRRG